MFIDVVLNSSAMQSVHITTLVLISNIDHGEVYSVQHHVITVVNDLRQVGDFLRVLRFNPPIKLTGMDIAIILLKVALITITLTHCKNVHTCLLTPTGAGKMNNES